jgi:hypothetical protein
VLTVAVTAPVALLDEIKVTLIFNENMLISNG